MTSLLDLFFRSFHFSCQISDLHVYIFTQLASFQLWVGRIFNATLRLKRYKISLITHRYKRKISIIYYLIWLLSIPKQMILGSVVPTTVVVKLCQLDINWSSKEFFCFQSKFVSFQEKLLCDVARHALQLAVQRVKLLLDTSTTLRSFMLIKKFMGWNWNSMEIGNLRNSLIRIHYQILKINWPSNFRSTI